MKHQMFEIMVWSSAVVLLLVVAVGFVPNKSQANAASHGLEFGVSTPAAMPTPQWKVIPTRMSMLPAPLKRADAAKVETKKWITWGEQRVRADVVDIRLSQFPRPAEDNGRGLHWFPTTGQKREVVDRFVPELAAMKIRWLVILQGVEDWDLTANDYLVERLNAGGIIPVMRIEARIGALDLERWRRIVTHYRAKGVRYFQLFNEPNIREEWAGREYPSVEMFIQYWIPAAEIVAQQGGLPGLAPLSPAANPADELFLDKELRLLVRAGRFDLVNVMWLAIHNYGGMDDKGFLRYRRYASISKSALGQYLPMLATEGGLGDARLSGDAVVTAFEQMRTREPWFLAYCPWLIGNAVGGGQDDMWENAAWFQRNGALPIVDRIKSLP